MNRAKKIISLLIFLVIMTFIFVFVVSDVPLITRYYDNIQYGIEPTEGPGKPGTEPNNNVNDFTPEQEETAKINRIYENFLASIDTDKYYAGAYWDGTPFIHDENGERVTDERGRPLRRYDRDLYVLVTDLKIVPRYLRTASPKLHFIEVKYSEIQLQNFRDIIIDKYIPVRENIDINKVQIWGMGIDTINNKVHIIVSSIFDISEMPEEIPDDAYYTEHGDGPAETVQDLQYRGE